MFGNILPDPSCLSEEQNRRYRAGYCGLCRTLKTEYGLWPRLTLSYDMTFLLLLLSSLYEPEETWGEARCAAHPTKKHSYFQNRYSSYTAAINTVLTFYKCLDDWKDDKKLSALLLSALLRPAARRVQERYPRQCGQMQQALARLTELEQADCREPDAPAAAFAQMMEAFFVPDETDHWAYLLRQVGGHLGRFIYLYDALLDLEADISKHRYNPLVGHVDPANKDGFLPILHVILGDCTAALDKLPLVQDTEILKNILYCGLWLPYARQKEQKDKKQKGRGRHV